MKTWLVGALAGACVGVVIYVALSRKPPAPAESRHEPSTPATPVATAPAPPVILTEVVEVTNIDHLLDPPVKRDTGIPFDEVPSTLPDSLPAGLERIPPAADGPEPAPMPREVPDRFAAIDLFHF